MVVDRRGQGIMDVRVPTKESVGKKLFASTHVYPNGAMLYTMHPMTMEYFEFVFLDLLIHMLPFNFLLI